MNDSKSGTLTSALPDTVAGLFNFPSACELKAAAELFPDERSAISEYGWRRQAVYAPLSAENSEHAVSLGLSRKRSRTGRTVADPGGTGYRDEFVAAHEYVETRAWKEGVFAQLVMAPGMLQFKRVNTAAEDRAIARRKELARRARHELVVRLVEQPRPYRTANEYLIAEMVTDRAVGLSMVRALQRPYTRDQAELADLLEEEHALRLDASRNVISRWSFKSRLNLRRTIGKLDLAPVVASGAPALLTLTLPGGWLAVAPTAAAASAIWNRFGTWWRDEFGEGMKGIWKREFQSRGAPHWHVWTVLPELGGDDQIHRPMALTIDTTAEWRAHLHDRIAAGWRQALDIPTPNIWDWEQSLKHGTDISYSEGTRARDPRRLSEYFLKESGTSAKKEYQNLPPMEWKGDRVGRYWGTRGIDQVTETVDLEPAHAHRLWRVIRHVRMSRRRIDGARPRIPGRAGFVMVNDGAQFATQLATFVNSYRFDTPPKEYVLSSGSIVEGRLPNGSPGRPGELRTRSASERYAMRSVRVAAERARIRRKRELEELEEMFEREPLPAALRNRI